MPFKTNPLGYKIARKSPKCQWFTKKSPQKLNICTLPGQNFPLSHLKKFYFLAFLHLQYSFHRCIFTIGTF